MNTEEVHSVLSEAYSLWQDDNEIVNFLRPALGPAMFYLTGLDVYECILGQIKRPMQLAISFLKVADTSLSHMIPISKPFYGKYFATLADVKLSLTSTSIGWDRFEEKLGPHQVSLLHNISIFNAGCVTINMFPVSLKSVVIKKKLYLEPTWRIHSNAEFREAISTKTLDISTFRQEYGLSEREMGWALQSAGNFLSNNSDWMVGPYLETIIHKYKMSALLKQAQAQRFS